MPNPDLLHIYSQENEHDDSYIIGNRTGLEKLKKAIEKALNNELSREAVMTNDGEGFDVFVSMCEEDWQGITWVNLAVPYTKDYAQENRPNAIPPWQFFKNAKKG